MTDATTQSPSRTTRPACPPWCTVTGWHAVHRGRQSVLLNPAVLTSEPPIFLRIELYREDTADRPGRVQVYTQGETEGLLDAVEVKRLATGLRARAADLEELVAWM